MSAREHDADDYGEDGLFRYGPQRARPSYVSMASAQSAPPPAPAPVVARAQTALRRQRARDLVERQQRFLDAIRRAA